MRQRLFEITNDLLLAPIERQPEAADGKVVWVDIESSTPAELQEYLKQRGVEDWLIDRVLDFNSRHEIYETDKTVFFNFPTPYSWRNDRHSTLRVILVAGTVITVRDFAFDNFEDWLHPRNSGRKVATKTVPGLLMWLFIGLLNGDAERFFQLRDKTEVAEQQMRDERHHYDHRALEELTASTNRLLTIMYDAHALLQALQLAECPVFAFNSHSLLLQKGADNLQTLREGLEALLRRLDNINQQHSINLQRQTDHRIRILTIFSVIFMPPTLITGIYGMNLENLPGIHSSDAYIVVFAIIIAIAAGMLVLFYRREWFS
jgi:magnesium transporter